MQRLMRPTLRQIQRQLLALLAGGRRSQSGQDLVEYALILGFIAVACAAIIPYTATESMRTIYSKIAEILMSSTNQT
jgi:Flp pilus assembly pilin Flp